MVSDEEEDRERREDMPPAPHQERQRVEEPVALPESEFASRRKAVLALAEREEDGSAERHQRSHGEEHASIADTVGEQLNSARRQQRRHRPKAPQAAEDPRSLLVTDAHQHDAVAARPEVVKSEAHDHRCHEKER